MGEAIAGVRRGGARRLPRLLTNGLMVLAAAGLPAVAGAELRWTTPEKIDSSSTGDLELSASSTPMCLVDDDSHLHFVFAGDGQPGVKYWSTRCDDGDWCAEVIGPWSDYGRATQPAIAAADGGALLIAWIETDETAGTGTVVLARSGNQGASWSVDSVPLEWGGALSNPSVAVFRSGMRMRGVACWTVGAEGRSRGSVLCTRWMGSTWTATGAWSMPVPLSSDSAADHVSLAARGEGPVIAPGELEPAEGIGRDQPSELDGVLVAAWDVEVGCGDSGEPATAKVVTLPCTEIQLSRSTDGGKTWSKAGPVTDGYRPSLAYAAGAGLYLGYQQPSGSALSAVYLRRSDDHGLTFSDPARVGPGSAPQVAAPSSSDDLALVAYRHRSLGSPEEAPAVAVYHPTRAPAADTDACTGDLPDELTPRYHELLGSSPGYQPRVCLEPHSVHAFWRDDSAAPPQYLWYRHGGYEPVHLGFMVHLEGEWSSPSARNGTVESRASGFEAHGAKATFESKILRGTFRAQDILPDLAARGHGVGVHADLCGTEDECDDTCDMTDPGCEMPAVLGDLLTVWSSAALPAARHISGICSHLDWVTAAITAGFDFTTGQIDYCRTSLDPAHPDYLDPEEHCSDEAGDFSARHCHDVWPPDVAGRLHPWRMASGSDWTEDDPAGGLVLLPSSELLACHAERTNGATCDPAGATFDAQDIDAFEAELREAIELSDPDAINQHYVSESIGRGLDDALIDCWLNHVDPYVAAGLVEWKTLPEIYDLPATTTPTPSRGSW